MQSSLRKEGRVLGFLRYQDLELVVAGGGDHDAAARLAGANDGDFRGGEAVERLLVGVTIGVVRLCLVNGEARLRDGEELARGRAARAVVAQLEDVHVCDIRLGRD